MPQFPPLHESILMYFSLHTEKVEHWLILKDMNLELFKGVNGATSSQKRQAMGMFFSLL